MSATELIRQPQGNKPATGKLLLTLHGAFLLLAGSIQLLLEGLGHFWQTGPYATIFGNSPYTLGFVEAHGLALLIGLLLLRAAYTRPTRQDSLLGAAVALLLGGANLIFWQSFVTFGMTGPGLMATVLHGVFLMGHLWWLLRK